MWIMAGKIDKVKGKVKVVVGEVTGDKELQIEGKLDQRAGEAKEKIGHVKDKVEEVAEKLERRAAKSIDKATHRAHKN
jgi:uncharacterized protein YjbJ (UPF0337 family)